MDMEQQNLQELCSRKLLDIFLTSEQDELKYAAKQLLDERKHFVAQMDEITH